jgi:hypothetical protein
MNPILKLTLLVVLVAAQAKPDEKFASKVDEKYQTGVDQLRKIVKDIKSCPKNIDFESKDKTGPFAGMRIYYGPALNVEWDVGESKAARAPYQAYIEAHVAQEFWLPPDVAKKYENSKLPDSYAKMFLPQPPVIFRYEFDLGPAGLELYRSLSRTSDKPEWEDYSPRKGRCWDEAVQKGVPDESAAKNR